MGTIEVAADVAGLSLACVWIEGCHAAAAAPGLAAWCAETVAQAASSGVPQARFDAVRGLLRHGGYRPAGRNKPAQEYLWRTWQTEGQLPAILDLVDVINAVSFAQAVPISLLALRAIGPAVRVRYGRKGESFVFNRSGQSLDLEGLLVCADADDRPLGTPVKDSMAGKIEAADTAAVAIAYAPHESVQGPALQSIAQSLIDGFRMAHPAARIAEQCWPA